MQLFVDKKNGYSNVVFHRQRNLFAYQQRNAIDIRNTDRGELIKRIEEAYNQFVRLYDATFLVSIDGRDSDTITLWDWTGKQILSLKLNRPLQLGEGDVYRVTFSPDGKILATCGALSPLETFDMTTGQRIRRFTNRDQSFSCLAYSPDGRKLAASDKHGGIRMWDTGKGKLMHHIHTGREAVSQIRFSPDGRILASCSEDGVVRRFDLDTGKELRGIRTGQPILNCLVFSPDSRKLFTSGGDIRQWDLETGTEIKVLEAHD